MAGDNSPYINIAGDWDTYLKKKAKHLRSNINYKNNMINKAGKYEIIQYCNENTEKAILDIFDILKRSWKSNSKGAINASKQRTAYFTEMLKTLSQNGWLRIWILTFNDNPIAFEFDLEYKDTVYAMQIGYDEKYGRFSPGLLLISQSMKAAFASGFRQYDFLGKEERFKMQLASGCRAHRKYYIYSNTVKGKLVNFIDTKIIRVLKMVFKGRDTIN